MKSDCLPGRRKTVRRQPIPYHKDVRLTRGNFHTLAAEFRRLILPCPTAKQSQVKQAMTRA